MITYSTGIAIAKHAGDETAEKIYKEIGRIMFRNLKKELGITTMDPFTYFNQLARYLEDARADVGYIAKIELKKIKENEFIMDAYGISVADVNARLRMVNVRRLNPLGNLMSAAFKEQSNMKAERRVEHTAEKLRKLGHGTVRWILSKIS